MGTVFDGLSISAGESDMDIDLTQEYDDTSSEYDSMDSHDGFVVHSYNSTLSASDSDVTWDVHVDLDPRNYGYRLRTRRRPTIDDEDGEPTAEVDEEVIPEVPQLPEQSVPQPNPVEADDVQMFDIINPPRQIMSPVLDLPVVIVDAVNPNLPAVNPSSAGRVQKTDDDPDNYSELCSICLESWTNSGSHRIAALQCGHLYGRICIEKWLRGDAKRCPQCNTKAKKSDIRNLCATSIRALDTAERDRAILELENERQMRRRVELEAAKLRLQLDSAVAEISKLKKDRHAASKNEQSRTISNWTAYQLQGESSSKSVELNLIYCKNIEVSREDGACRVLACSGGMGMMVASVHSAAPIMPGYGVKKYYMADYQTTQYMHIHSEQIRDLAFHPTRIDGLLLSASMDKSVKITSVLTNNIVQSFPLDSAAWSCTWNHDNDYQLFAGCGNGATFLYDIRQTTSHLQKLTSDKRTPVTSLQYVNQDGMNAFCGGVVVGHLNGTVLHEAFPSDQYKVNVLPLDGNVSSLSFEPSSRLLLVSMRPTEHHRNARHIVCELNKEISDASCTESKFQCNVIQTFVGGVSQKLLMRSRIFTHPNNRKSALVCAGDESSSSAMIWDVGTAACLKRLRSESPVVDICAVNNDSFTLATLAGRFITLYSSKPVQ